MITAGIPAVSCQKAEGNNLNGSEGFHTNNGSSQGQNLVLTVSFVQVFPWGGNDWNGCEGFHTKKRSSQGQNLVLTVLLVPSSRLGTIHPAAPTPTAPSSPESTPRRRTRPCAAPMKVDISTFSQN